MDSELIAKIEFIAKCDAMKSVYRRTMLCDMSRRETDAEHSWHLALAALVLREYADPSVDIDRVIRMGLVHDLVEIYAGDTFAYDAKGYEDKEQRESAAADRLFGMLDEAQGREFRALWEEFDAMQSADALFASAIDRFQPFLNNTRTNGFTWVEGHVTREAVLKRMEPIKRAIPALWGYVTDIIDEGCANGYIRQ